MATENYYPVSSTYVENQVQGSGEVRNEKAITYSPPHTGAISNVRINLYGYCQGLPDLYGFVLFGSGTAYYIPGTTYADYATNPNTGLAWTWSEIAAITTGGLCDNEDTFDNFPYAAVTSITVTYTGVAGTTVSDTIHTHDALGLKSILGMADVVHAHDALVAWVGRSVSDAVHLHDALAILSRSFLADVVYAHDSLGLWVRGIVADIVHAHDAVVAWVSTIVSDTVHVKDALVTFFGYIVSVADVVHVRDTMSTWVSAIVADVVHTKDELSAFFGMMLTVADTVHVRDALGTLVSRIMADIVHLRDSAEGHPFYSLMVSDIIHVKDCVVRWRWLTALRNLGRGRCPSPTVRTQDSIDDGYKGLTG